MTTIRWKLYNELKALFPDADIHITYGAETKERRRAFDVGKKKEKPAHSSPPDYETKNVVSPSDGVSCADFDERK